MSKVRRFRTKGPSVCLAQPSGLIVPHKSVNTLPPGLPRTERQFAGYKRCQKVIVSPLRACPGGSNGSGRVVTSDRGKPDGEFDSNQNRRFFSRNGSHSVVDSDRGKPDGNPARKDVWYDEPSGLGSSVWHNYGSLRQCRLFIVIALALLSLSVGCRPADLATTYGERRGSQGGPSVNGTAVLAGMFEQAGHRVSSWSRLSPKLEECQTIVWFPDDFEPPTVEQRDFLEWWLFNDTGRTVVYVGRDFDATPTFWEQALPDAPPEQKMEVMRREAASRASHDAARNRMPDENVAEWFTVYRDKAYRKVDSLKGPWSEKVDAAKTDIEIAGRLELPNEANIDAWMARTDNSWEGRPEFTPLLESGDDAIAYSIRYDEWDDSKIIVINNGSFLLNLPLVNHEHRTLAGHLVSSCGPGRVVFVESGAGGPTVFDEEPGTNIPTGFEVFTVWPLGFIVMHLTVLGILCCIAIYPIFGRPKTAPSSASSRTAVAADALVSADAATVIRADFGKHIDALGELLELTEDRQYARDRVSYYHEHVSRDSGTSHRGAK